MEENFKVFTEKLAEVIGQNKEVLSQLTEEEKKKFVDEYFNEISKWLKKSKKIIYKMIQ